MWPFPKKKDSGPPQFITRGQPLHTNPDPVSNQSIRRHLSRILTCMDVLQRNDLPVERMASLNAEIDRRRLQMQGAGFMVPGPREGIEAMLKKYGG